MTAAENLTNTYNIPSGITYTNAIQQQIGILSTLHCKKLKLAVTDALSDHPSSLSKFSHECVANWLVDIGLPQFQRTFLDARFDGLMLNSITLEDLKLLDVTIPFHIVSIKRALQALRQGITVSPCRHYNIFCTCAGCVAMIRIT